MDFQALLDSIFRTDPVSLAASSVVMAGNLIVIFATSWAYAQTRQKAFLVLSLAAVGASLLVLGDYVLAPHLVAWSPDSARWYRWSRLGAYALLSGARAGGIWLLALAMVRQARAQPPPPLVPQG